MTDTAVAEAPDTEALSAQVTPSAQVAEVADTFVELMRSFARARARMLSAAEHDVEWSAQLVLKMVHNDGPMRAGAIADLLQSDPSTVSRQVAALVRDGLLERRADPQDGRASLLVVTPRGEDVVADHNRIRLEYFADMLDRWSEQELSEFAAMLRRFTADYDAIDHDRWMTMRFARRTTDTTDAGSTTR